MKMNYISIFPYLLHILDGRDAVFAGNVLCFGCGMIWACILDHLSAVTESIAMAPR